MGIVVLPEENASDSFGGQSKRASDAAVLRVLVTSDDVAYLGDGDAAIQDAMLQVAKQNRSGAEALIRTCGPVSPLSVLFVKPC